MRRQIVTAVRNAQRGKHGPLTGAARAGVTADGETVDLVEMVADVNGDPADVLVLREEFATLLTAVRDRLSPMEHRAIVGLLAGLSYAEIEGAAPGLKPKWVDNALLRARAKLRRLAAWA